MPTVTPLCYCPFPPASAPSAGPSSGQTQSAMEYVEPNLQTPCNVGLRGYCFTVPGRIDSNNTEVTNLHILYAFRAVRNTKFKVTAETMNGRCHTLLFTSPEVPALAPGGESPPQAQLTVKLEFSPNMWLTRFTSSKTENGERIQKQASFAAEPRPAALLRPRPQLLGVAPPKPAIPGMTPSAPPPENRRRMEFDAGPDQAPPPHFPAVSPDDMRRRLEVVAYAMRHLQIYRTSLSHEQYSTVYEAAKDGQEACNERLAQITLWQRMAFLSNQPEGAPQVIDAAKFPVHEPLPSTYYSRVTIDGPYEEHQQSGIRLYYHEDYNGELGACAKNAANNMIGGPMFSLTNFAQVECDAQAQLGTKKTRADIEATMLSEGVNPQTVRATLLQAKIATHTFSFVPSGSPQGDMAQRALLDGVNTDRMFLAFQTELLSHVVAFRKGPDGWVLLAPAHGLPQVGVRPSAVLSHYNATGFIGIWPINRLVAA